MEDGNNENPADGESTGASESAADSSPQYITRDDLRSMMQDFLKSNQTETRKIVAGMLKTQPQQTEKASKPANEPARESEPVDVQALIRKERAIERTIASHGLNDAQADLVRGLVDAQNPENVGEFVSEFVQTMGIAKSESAQTQKQPAKANPASDGGSPGMTPSPDSDDAPVWQWSQAKVDSYIKQHGWRKFGQMARERLNKDVQGVSFSLTQR